MAQFFKSNIEARKLADGTYEIDVHTVDAGVPTKYNLKLSSGFDSTDVTVVDSQVIGDNTSTTYRLKTASLGDVKVHIAYETGGLYVGNHNLILKVKPADLSVETVEKQGLTDAVSSVPAQGNKSDEAFTKLTAAKDAAQAVVDRADATKSEVSAAIKAVQEAAAEFTASADVTPGTPGTNPGVPGAPGTNPGAPGTNPSTPGPGTNPGTPGTNPGTPGPNPGTPETNPGPNPGPNPGGTPGTNPGTPGTPGTNPGNPGTNPGTPGTPGVTVDVTGLQKALEKAAAITQGAKTDGAWEALQNAIRAAQEILDNGPSSQAVVDEGLRH